MRNLEIGQCYKNGNQKWILLGNNTSEKIQVYFKFSSLFSLTEYAIVRNTVLSEINKIQWDYSIGYEQSMYGVVELLNTKGIDVSGINTNGIDTNKWYKEVENNGI